MTESLTDEPGTSDTTIVAFRFHVKDTNPAADIHQEEWTLHVELEWIFIRVGVILWLFVVETFLRIEFSQVAQALDQCVQFIAFLPTQFQSLEKQKGTSRPRRSRWIYFNGIMFELESTAACRKDFES